MSAATAQACVVCQASSSKYKCSTCRSATCSLACSKQHSAQGHPGLEVSKQASSGTPATSQDRLLPSLQLRNETIEAPPAHRFTNVDKYVGLKEYDSKQLMEDFEYLQYLGKCVTSLGKDITKNGWMKEEASQKPNIHHHQQQRGGAPGRGGHHTMNKNANSFRQHLPAEVKNRQTFESWIRKLKLPIMLLPDGMSLRKENQTRWKNKTKQLLCTVEIRFPSSASTSASKSRWLLHHIPWDKQISEVVVKEIERRSKQKSKVAVEVDTEEVDDMCKGLTTDNWSDSLCIAVSVSNDRLRNESSSRFLEWWQRQVKNGIVKAGGLQFDEEKKGALEQLRSGAWAAIEGIESAEAWPATQESEDQTELHADEEASSGSGLISSMLLERMQAARAMKAQIEATNTLSQERRILKDSSAPATGTRRSLVVLDGKETFQELLQNLSKGLAIVEYFHLEVWTKRALLEQIKGGVVVRERLEGQSESDEDLRPVSRKRGQDEQDRSTSVQAKRAKVAIDTSSNALVSLTAYASSDEEDEEAQEEEEVGSQNSDEMSESPPTAAVGLAAMARMLGMVPS